jgi:large subunit ribosomal protein L4
MGLRIALSVRLRERNILVVPSVAWPNGKTRHIAQRLNGLELGKRCLIVTGEREVPPKLLRATRNLQEVVCKTAEELQVWDVLHTSQIILSLDAVEWLHNSLGKSNVFPKADEHPSDKPSHDSAGIHPSSEGTASEAAV